MASMDDYNGRMIFLPAVRWGFIFTSTRMDLSWQRHWTEQAHQHCFDGHADYVTDEVTKQARLRL